MTSRGVVIQLRYEGDPRSRDGAYHQGTVWPWLMGPFITAYLKTHGEAGRAQAKTWREQSRRWLVHLVRERSFILPPAGLAPPK